MNILMQFLLFIAILLGLKYLLGLPISIVGSVVLTLVLTLIFSAFSRARA